LKQPGQNPTGREGAGYVRYNDSHSIRGPHELAERPRAEGFPHCLEEFAGFVGEPPNKPWAESRNVGSGNLDFQVVAAVRDALFHRLIIAYRVGFRKPKRLPELPFSIPI
jgi:hypothetical protein